MTLQQVGDVFGISKVSVSNWESGTNQPDPKKLNELAKLLDTDIQFLLTGETKTKPNEVGSGVPFVIWSELGKPESNPQKQRLHATHTIPGPNSFGTKLPISEFLHSEKPNLPEGSLIIVDPDLKPQPLDFVLIEHDSRVKIAQVRSTPENKYWINIFSEKDTIYIDINNINILGIILEWQLSGKVRVN